MALTACPDCKARIAETAVSCPRCGHVKVHAATAELPRLAGRLAIVEGRVGALDKKVGVLTETLNGALRQAGGLQRLRRIGFQAQPVETTPSSTERDPSAHPDEEVP